MVDTLLLTQPRGGGDYLAELPADIIVYGYRENRPGPISFDLSLLPAPKEQTRLVSRDDWLDSDWDDSDFSDVVVNEETYTLPNKISRDVIAEGVHEVVVIRNRQVVWVGPILTVEENESSLGVGGEGLLSYLRKWHVTSTLTFSQVDQFTLARTLIDHHQDKAGGDFGIDTSGSDLSGVLRDRTYEGFRRKNIYDAVLELAEVDNGFGLDIDPATRTLRLHYPKQGTRKPDLIWEDGIRKFTRSFDATSQASQVLGVGTGERDDTLLRNIQDSTAVGKYGLTQAVYTNKDVSQADSLEDHVRRELSKFRNPAQVVGVTVGSDNPTVFSYEISDEGQLRYDSLYDPVNEFRRLVGFDVVFEEGDERVVLYLQDVTA